MVWVTLDLIAVDRAFTRALQERLAVSGTVPATLIVSASHTHSGPGAFMEVAKDFESFGDAILKKMIVEIAMNNQPVPRRQTMR